MYWKTSPLWLQLPPISKVTTKQTDGKYHRIFISFNIGPKYAQCCQPYTCLYLSWMRSTFSGFLTLKNPIWDNDKHFVWTQPFAVEFSAEDNNEKNGENDDEGDGDQDHGVVDKHPGGENIGVMIDASNALDVPWVRILLDNLCIIDLLVMDLLDLQSTGISFEFHRHNVFNKYSDPILHLLNTHSRTKSTFSLS